MLLLSCSLFYFLMICLRFCFDKISVWSWLFLCWFACLFVRLFALFRGGKRVEGEWDKREETGTKMGTELQCVVVPVGKGGGGDVFLKRINTSISVIVNIKELLIIA